MNPLQFWMIVFLVSACLGTFWFALAVGAWMLLALVGLLAGLGVIFLVGIQDKAPRA